MFNFINLDKKKILLIGASQGIGRDTAILLSKLGAQLILVARNEDNLKETQSLLEGSNHSYYSFDLYNIDQIEDFVKNVVNKIGSLDGLVYCAGVSVNRPLKMFKPNDVDRIMKVNFNGFIEFIRCCVKRGRYGDSMNIVGVSSVAALKGDKTQTIYSASKAAMNGAMRCLAKELAERNIRINTVAPSMVKTRMYQDFLNKYGEESESNKKIFSRQYLGIGETDDIASAIAYLLSDASRFITGVCLPVDGGYTSN